MLGSLELPKPTRVLKKHNQSLDGEQSGPLWVILWGQVAPKNSLFSSFCSKHANNGLPHARLTRFVHYVMGGAWEMSIAKCNLIRDDRRDRHGK